MGRQGAPAPDADTGRLSLADINLIRFTVADGQTPAEIAARTGRTLQEVETSIARLNAAFSIQSPRDWLPVLSGLVANGRLSVSDCAQAITNLSAEPGFGAAEPWRTLIVRLEAAGLPANEASILQWNLNCTQYKLDRQERAMLVQLAGAPASCVPDQDISKLSPEVQTRLAIKLNADDGLYNHDQKANNVAQAAWIGLLPPGSHELTVDAACIQVHARRLDYKIDTSQAALLLDLRAGRTEEQLIGTHGEDFTAIGGRTWQALKLPGHWIGAHQAGAMVDRATQLGLFNRVARPAPVDPPAIRLSLPETETAVPLVAVRPVFQGYPLASDIIAAAPSLDADQIETFKQWQVEDHAVPAGQTYMQGFVKRKALEKSLGNPDPQEILAIAAKAADEGKLTPHELFAVQRKTAASSLGLHKGLLDTLEPLAAGCTVAQADIWLGTDHARTDIASLMRKLGVGGSPNDLPVRQQILNAAFAEGLIRHPVTLSDTPPSEVSLAPGRVAKARPDFSQTVYSNPVTTEEVARAPSIAPSDLQNFRNLTISFKPESEWSENGNVKRRMLTALGNPDLRGVAAIATKAMNEGKLTLNELEQVEHWTVLKMCGLTRKDSTVLSALAAGLSISDTAAALSMQKASVAYLVKRVCQFFDPPLAANTDGALRSAMVKVVENGIAEPSVPGSRLSPLEPLSRAEIDGAADIPVTSLQTFKDSKVYHREQKDWTLGEHSHRVEIDRLNRALNYPSDRDLVAIAAKATEQGVLTQAEFVQSKRWIAASIAGLTRANMHFLDVLNDVGTLSETAAFIGGSPSGNSLHFSSISKAIGFTERSNSPGVEARLLQAAFDNGLLLKPPSAHGGQSGS